MKVTVNDSELLRFLGFSQKGIAVAVNEAVVPRSRWESAVPADARVDVVTAVQGG